MKLRTYDKLLSNFACNCNLRPPSIKELHACGANVIVTCRSSSPELDALEGVQVILGCDIRDTASVAQMAAEVTTPVDILINNVGGHQHHHCQPLTLFFLG